MQCAGCHALFNRAAPSPPFALRTATVPMTTVVNPGPWYTRLSTYKTFDFPKGDLLTAVARLFLISNEGNLAGLLGGAPTLTTIVPSTSGISYADQPLRRTLARSPELNEQLTEGLTYIKGRQTKRRAYTPDVFRASIDVVGARVVLIEDTWVTGATAISAAGALLAAGALSVALFPIARIVEKNSYLSPKYLELMDDSPWQSTNWSR